MAKISLRIKSTEKRLDGTAPVVFAFSTGGNSSYLLSGVYTEPKNFDSKTRHLIGRRFANTDIELQTRLASFIRASEKLAEKVNINNLTAAQFRDRVVLLSSNKSDSEPLIERMKNYASTRKAQRTREIYEQTIARVKEYDPNAEYLYLDDITRQWLKDFEQWLINRGNSTNTRSIHFRNLRAVFKDAIDDEVTANNPFRKFKIEFAQTMHRDLSAEQLKALFNVRLADSKEEARDIFKLVFYLIGINITDLFGITDIRNGRIEYDRSKTGKHYSVKVEPEAMVIIDKYRGTTKLLSICERFRNAHQLDMWMNDQLQRIRLTELLDVDLTLYWARHTWASMAAELDISKETIARALGHGKQSVTDVYINFNRKKVDEANRKVIDFVNSL